MAKKLGFHLYAFNFDATKDTTYFHEKISSKAIESVELSNLGGSLTHEPKKILRRSISKNTSVSIPPNGVKFEIYLTDDANTETL